MPKELTIEITNYCRQHCIHCSTDATPLRPDAVFLRTYYVKVFMDKYHDFENIRFSGGEPFEHKGLPIFLKEAKKRNRRTTVLTSGVVDDKPFEDDMIKKCSPYIDEFIFSMHGFYLDHDRIVSSEENELDIPDIPYWDTMHDSLDVAMKYEIPYNFEAVVMKKNIDKLEDIVKAVKYVSKITSYCKPNLHLLKLVHQGRAKNLPRLTEEEIARVPKLAEEFSKKHNVQITYTKSFDCKQECDCGSKKAAIVIVPERANLHAIKFGMVGLEEIGCSALKEYTGTRNKFPCKDY